MDVDGIRFLVEVVAEEDIRFRGAANLGDYVTSVSVLLEYRLSEKVVLAMHEDDAAFKFSQISVLDQRIGILLIGSGEKSSEKSMGNVVAGISVGNFRDGSGNQEALQQIGRNLSKSHAVDRSPGHERGSFFWLSVNRVFNTLRKDLSAPAKLGVGRSAALDLVSGHDGLGLFLNESGGTMLADFPKHGFSELFGGPESGVDHYGRQIETLEGFFDGSVENC